LLLKNNDNNSAINFNRKKLIFFFTAHLDTFDAIVAKARRTSKLQATLLPGISVAMPVVMITFSFSSSRVFKSVLGSRIES